MKIKIKNHRMMGAVPDNSEMIGKVTSEDGDGALILLGDEWKFVRLRYKIQYDLDQRKVHTAIIRAIKAEFCDSHADLALAARYSLDSVKSWSVGRRVPNLGVIVSLLRLYKIIQRKPC